MRCSAAAVVIPQVFDINPLKAWAAVAVTLSSVAASLYLISVSPWYLLPFAWFIAGTAFTGVSHYFHCGLHALAAAVVGWQQQLV